MSVGEAHRVSCGKIVARRSRLSRIAPQKRSWSDQTGAMRSTSSRSLRLRRSRPKLGSRLPDTWRCSSAASGRTGAAGTTRRGVKPAS